MLKKKRIRNIIEISLEELQVMSNGRECRQKLKSLEKQLIHYRTFHSDDSFLQNAKKKYCKLKIQLKGRKKKDEQVRIG